MKTTGLTSRNWNGKPVTNQSMLRKVQDGTALELSGNQKVMQVECSPKMDGKHLPMLAAGCVKLTPEQAQKVEHGDYDLCDISTESWVWSVGIHEATGICLAAFDARLYQQEGFRCIWFLTGVPSKVHVKSSCQPQSGPAAKEGEGK